MIGKDAFRCPRCEKGIVNITYIQDARGKHPDTGLKCDLCKSMYSINMA